MPGAPPATARRVHGRALAVGGVALIVALAGVGLWRFLAIRNADAPLLNSLAVLPLSNHTGNPEQDYVADGMTDTLITKLAAELGQSGGPRVISRTSVVQYKNSKKPLPEIARELNVDGIIEGAVIRSGSRVQITAQLIDVRTTERPLWAKVFDSDPNDLVGLQQEVAQAVRDRVAHVRLPLVKGSVAHTRPVSAEAYQLLFESLHAAGDQNYEGFRNAIAYTRRAIDKQPDFALAYARLALYYFQFSFTGPLAPKEFMPEAEAAARKSIDLDDNLAEGHAVLAHVLRRFKWDWPGSEREYLRALALNPNYADGHRMFSVFLSATGRLDEGISQAVRARDLDPFSGQAMSNLGQAYLAAGQYERAVAEFQKGLDKQRNRGRLHRALGLTYVQMGRLKDGVAQLETAVNLTPDNVRFRGDLAYAYAMSGRTTEARNILNELQRLASTQYVPSSTIARIYAGLDDKREALAWLQRACEERDGDLVDPGADVGFATLQSDPRYHSIFTRVGISR
jgi:TolB-like protein/Flp pilus assembly protein TadD